MSSTTGSVDAGDQVDDEEEGKGDDAVQLTFDEPDAAAQLLRFVLQWYRERAGKTQGEVAERVGLKQPTIAHIENGRTLPSQAHLELMLHFYGQADQFDVLRDVRNIAARKDDAEAAAALGSIEDIDLLYGLQHFAVSIEAYEPRVINGLLQTDETTEVWLHDHAERTPGYDIDKARERRVRRQQVLFRPDDPVKLSMYIEEDALKPVGGADAHERQLQHLVRAVTEHRNIEVRVIPRSVVLHPAQQGTIMLLTLPGDLRVAYGRTFQSAYYYRSNDALSNAARTLGQLRDLSLKQPESLALLNRLMEVPA